MAGAEDLVTYVFRWHTVVDDVTCQKCLPLDGKEWRGQDLFENVLWDEIYDKVWDLDANYSLLHPNCRCQLEVTVEVHLEKIEVYDFTVGRPQPTAKTARFKILSADISALRQSVSNLIVDIREAKTSAVELNRLLTTYISLARRAGLPENVVNAIARIQQLRVMVQTLTTAIQTMYAATGPIGWLLAVGGFAISTVMLVDQMSMRRSRY